MGEGTLDRDAWCRDWTVQRWDGRKGEEEKRRRGEEEKGRRRSEEGREGIGRGEGGRQAECDPENLRK